MTRKTRLEKLERRTEGINAFEMWLETDPNTGRYALQQDAINIVLTREELDARQAAHPRTYIMRISIYYDGAN